jgi:plasmid stabilization system protein ParE
MAVKVRWSPEAYNDIELIAEYISRDSKNYASSVVKTIIEKAKNLELSPKSGRIVPEFENEIIREVFAYHYRIIYEVKSDESVLILAIIHGRRKLKLNKK